jgi:cytochrome c oxidase cbb3-type subunit 3
MELDQVTGQSTTGHEWDGIKELNTPLPRWWVNVFYATIIWSFAYWVAYPAWPMVSDFSRGVLGYASRAELAKDMAALDAQRDLQAAGMANASLEQIKADPALFRIAMARGKAAFGDNCVPCHGVGGTGGIGFPSLVDDEWIWGGSLDAIQTTLLHGARWSQDNRTRQGDMLAFGKLGVLKREEIGEVVEYVRKLAKLDVKPGSDAAKGAELFEANCASCHGAEAKGNAEFGAPDLTDAVWLYGSSRTVMTETVVNGRAGVMPAWGGRLDPTTIKALTVYVHSLGGGQ